MHAGRFCAGVYFGRLTPPQCPLAVLIGRFAWCALRRQRPRGSLSFSFWPVLAAVGPTRGFDTPCLRK